MEEDLEVDITLPQNIDIVNMEDKDYEMQHPMYKLGEDIEETPDGNEKLKPEDEIFRIKNIETGESYDLRENNIQEKLNPQQQTNLQGVPWNNYKYIVS